ncbi:hypothetical protein K440DRAFT_203431 [Wilcoxina mikolae CBS 423.85]|nr:hypothetical protein K440DRAFT_203431 [Wilcoxina mikolae CBS 423.85]
MLFALLRWGEGGGGMVCVFCSFPLVISSCFSFPPIVMFTTGYFPSICTIRFFFCLWNRIDLRIFCSFLLSFFFFKQTLNLFGESNSGVQWESACLCFHFIYGIFFLFFFRLLCAWFVFLRSLAFVLI